MKPMLMQGPRVYLHTNMHGNQTQQPSDLEHRASMQQQCVLSSVDHHGQVEGCLQQSTLEEQPGRLSRLQFSPGSLLQRVNQQISAEGTDLQLSSSQEGLQCSGCLDPTNLEPEDSHRGLQSQPNQILAEGKDLHWVGCKGLTNLEPEDPHGRVQSQLNPQINAEGKDLQVSSLQEDMCCSGFQDPTNLEPHGGLKSGLNLQISAESKDFRLSRLQEDSPCLGCPDPTNLEPEDPHGELQSQLNRLRLGESKVHLVKRQRPQEREPYQPFHHHDVKGHFTDIRYPEPLSTEESPRSRRARSLPWNSIPEEEEEDSVMCCYKLKKKVKFADSLGLTLASIKHFLPSDEPLVPQAVLARLQSYPPTARGQRSDLILEDEFSCAEVAPSEATPVELLEKLEEQGVCLEQVSASRLGVLGYVLAKDPEEKAQVKIRYTFNEWLSFLDCPATPTGQSTALPSASGCRRFHFNLCYPPTTLCIQFAICFNTGHGQEIWDNNKGANYTVSCQPDVVPEIQQSSPDREEWEGSQLW